MRIPHWTRPECRGFLFSPRPSIRNTVGRQTIATSAIRAPIRSASAISCIPAVLPVRTATGAFPMSAIRLKAAVFLGCRNLLAGLPPAMDPIMRKNPASFSASRKVMADCFAAPAMVLPMQSFPRKMQGIIFRIFHCRAMREHSAIARSVTDISRPPRGLTAITHWGYSPFPQRSPERMRSFRITRIPAAT